VIDVLGLDRAVHPWIAESEQRVRFGLGTLGWRAGSELLGLGQQAEQLGFDSYWVQDHPMGGPDCWTSLAALAVTTQRLRLGSIVSCVYYRSPVLLARHAADVDRLSGGRLVLGVGFGDDAAEFRQMNLALPAVPERQAALEETVQVVRGLWTGQPFTFSGRHFSFQDATLPAGPVQQPYVPVLIAGGGERVTLRQVAEHADVSNFGENAWAGGARTLEDTRRKLDALRRHCASAGRPYEAILKSHIGLPVIVSASKDALEAKLESRFGALPADQAARNRASTVSGTPDDLIGYYHGLIGLGIRYFIAAIYSDDVESRELLARRVMPEFV
jgi:alkanesulfonate monooxygenase SsuD/methylene tetrahydromethanopterin reductase-like flavin-dependent oxidoreductase (luciferase family)